MIKKKDRIVKAAKKRHFCKDQKCGIELPKSVKRAHEMDKETGAAFWRDATEKEMKAVMKAFQILEEGESVPPGCKGIAGHPAFDLKISLTRKARCVAGGHLTEPPASIACASVVSRESARIAFMLATLNGLDVLAADAANAHLNAPPREKVWVLCGDEFGRHKGKKALTVQALCGLKSSGAAWRSHLTETLRNTLKFQMCRADNDVWMCKAIKKDGTECWEHSLVRTDDILTISEDPKAVMDSLAAHVALKKDSAKEPEECLGASIGKCTFEDGDVAWSMGSERHVKEAVRNVKGWLEKMDPFLKKKAPLALPTGCCPEMDLSSHCNEADHSFHQEQAGVLRWAVELGRINICCEVSMLASHCAAPRVGHLKAPLHVFAH